MKTFLVTLSFLLAASGAFAQSSETLNPDVHQDTIATTICQKGYTKSVRPATSYTNGVKRKLMREQGIDFDEHAADYELDHIIPLTLGGHPRNIHNLQLQKWDGEDGAKMKDKLEVKLSHMVCKGKMPLSDAQTCIRNDWQSCAKRYRR